MRWTAEVRPTMAALPRADRSRCAVAHMGGGRKGLARRHEILAASISIEKAARRAADAMNEGGRLDLRAWWREDWPPYNNGDSSRATESLNLTSGFRARYSAGSNSVQ